MAHRLSPEAEADLDGIWHYTAIKSGSMEIADRLIDSITARFNLLSRNPFMGRNRDDVLRPGLRSFPGGEALIIYRIEDGDIIVLHVVRGSRDIQAVLGR